METFGRNQLLVLSWISMCERRHASLERKLDSGEGR